MRRFILLMMLFITMCHCKDDPNAVNRFKRLSNKQRCSSPTHLPGPQCAAFFKRYTFNKNTKKCEEFIYGGCHPSPNNFMTIEECEKTCVKS